jgi:serine/threonine protein kinase
MTDQAALAAAFPELEDIQSLGAVSGQKEVYTAVLNGQKVALKLVLPSRAVSRSEDRLEREVAAMAALDSDYVPTLHDHGRREVGGIERVFIVEDFIEGETLRTRLVRDGIPDLSEVIELGSKLLEACCDFEAEGLVHRDIKPENLMIDPSGKLWVIDFGLVRFLDLESLTASADHFGPCTFGYGAPEQLRNRKPEIDIRADLFAVGVVLYELCTGANPHLRDRNFFSIIRSVETFDLPRLRLTEDKKGALADFIAAASSRFRSRRPDSATNARDWFKDVVDSLLDGDE